MRELLRQYQALFLSIIMIIWPLYTFISGGGERAETGPLDDLSLRVLGGLQSHADGSYGSITDFWDQYIDLVDVKSENVRLRLDNSRLQEENIRLQGVLQENARLSKLVGFKETNPALKLLPARVIAADLSLYFRTLRIRLDVGGEEVKPGMPVVAAAGIVGQIERVSGDFCDVILAVDPRSNIDVITQSNRARGVLRGLGHDHDYLAEISYLEQRDEVEEDDLIVTSGRGGHFPKELHVGRIIQINKQEFGLYQSVLIQPTVDFSRLEEVFIITNVPRYEDPTDPSSEDP